MASTFLYASKGDSVTGIDGYTIHLAEEATWVMPNGRTLCGRSLQGLTFGDETQSGIAATCKSCIRIAHNRNWPQS